MAIATCSTTLPDVVLPTCTVPQVLQGQKALVTGGNSGIGLGVALALGRAGADVVVNYVANDEAAQQVVEDIRQGGVQAYACKADVSQEEQVQAMFARMFDVFGTIDILINNAGLQRDAPLDQMTLAQWNTVLSINLTGQFLGPSSAEHATVCQGTRASGGERLYGRPGVARGVGAR